MKIVNARLITCEGQNFENGYIAFEDGRITALGDMDQCPPRTPEDYNAEGGYVIPGFIDAHCHVGCGPEATGSAEYSELLDPIVPHYDGADAFLPLDAAIPKCLKRGITTVVSGPGSTTLIGGQLAAFKLNGEYAPKACIRRACAIKFALGTAPISTFSGKGRGPSTRMSAAALLREALESAREYMEKKDAGEHPAHNAKWEALIPLLKGEIPAHIHAQRTDDIRMAIQLSEEFGFRLIVVHGVQVLPLLDEMKRVGAGIIHGPLMFTSRDLESDGISFANPIATQSAGILTAVCTDACPGLGYAQILPANGSMMMREGMSMEGALRTITIDAAKACAIDHRVGSLKVGKDADIVVFDDMPLEFTAHTKAVFVDGRRVKL